MAETIPNVLVALPREGTEAAVAALGSLQGVQVQAGLAPALVTSDQARPLRIRHVGLSDLRSTPHPTDAELWIVDGVLDDDAQARLEDAGIAFVDAAGTAWVPGIPRSTRRRVTRPIDGTGSRLRAPSILMGQWLADHPDEPVNAPSLARHGGASTLSAKHLLRSLEERGFVSAAGRGRAATRAVIDVRGLRAWLAMAGRPRRTQRVACFLRDPFNIPAVEGAPALTLTGAAAAERIGLPVLSRVPRALYRVAAAEQELEDVPAALGGTRVGRGANAVLIADPHALATHDLRRGEDGSLRAPPSRIMLDLFLEPRGEAAVDLFLELWRDRVL
jgi:hypothetical protein